MLDADSFEFPAGRTGFDRDCRRYDRLVLDDWFVLRFTREMVMVEPGPVAAVIRESVAHQQARGRRAGRSTGTSPVRRRVPA